MSQSNTRQEAIHATEVRVGLFVFVLLVIAAAVIFAIGSERRLFESRATLYTSFPDVGGLQEGAIVRVGGVNVGTVSRILFTDSAGADGKPEIEVQFRVTRGILPRIHTDSVVQIQSMGLLGDMLLSVSLGGPGTPPAGDGTRLRGMPALNLAQVEADAAVGLRQFADTAQTVNTATHALLTPELIASVRSSVSSLDTLSGQTVRGPGLAHDLFYSPTTAARLSDLLANGAGAASAAQRYIDAAANRPGAVDLLANLSRAADSTALALSPIAHAAGSIATIADAIRSDRGLVHRLIFDAETGDMLAQLDQSARDLRAVADGVVQGRGTLGALLVDPTLYEQAKALIMDLQRNWVTRGVTRFVISHEEGQ